MAKTDVSAPIQMCMDGLHSMDEQMRKAHRQQSLFIALNGFTSAWVLGSMHEMMVMLGYAFAAFHAVAAVLFSRRANLVVMRIGQLSYVLSSTVLFLFGVLWISSGLLLDGALLLILGIFGVIRTRRIEDPRYRSWYTSGSTGLAQSMLARSNEVIASCPSCTSLLAIVVEQMTANDICPHCGQPLVPSALSEAEQE
ncbi:MAG: Uncharacterised protein [Methanobacteriota archaeon]|nr:hypothetical protein [Euryarchaeota archaeon]CAI8222208.1 MAG: Uncharacterised protein [Euryarchaeota archaeon]